ncbi:MAG: diiron oxygenase [Gammaproteobacteria bacterium]|nr:diiron oxygenase [Gammaproteobacteria bacterium]MDH4254799.1 diiron oxygenase [Gammaproteobacteria bacterium]MDH5310795.1 diiron oxygenase [Gammaproteobacteria bacterium]
MSTMNRYQLPVTDPDFRVGAAFDTHFRWEYDDGRRELLDLYEKGKKKQWNASDRIDWSLELDPENPGQMPEEIIPIFGTRAWERMTPSERVEARFHYQSWQLSQFLHGEQGALLCAAKIVQQVPAMDAKFYAATQVVDEARHVEAYSRLLHDKFGMLYPIGTPLCSLLEDVLGDSRWDMTYLGMQVLVEGLALAAFAGLRDMAGNPLVASVNAYVMQDEARHVAFGRLSLRDYYPHLTQAERDEREEFAAEACYLMRDRFLSTEVWRRLGLPLDEIMPHLEHSAGMRLFRTRLFTRIVPMMKDIGLWGPRIRRAYGEMGILGFADSDVAAMTAEDEDIADRFDREIRARMQDIRQTAGSDG